VLLGALSRPRRPHAPHPHAIPRTAAQAHTALCAAPGAAPATTTEAGPGRRAVARGRLPSVRPRAAVRPSRRRGARAPHRVPHPAPQRTLRKRGRFRSPSTRSSLAQREASVAPAHPPARRAHRGPRVRLAPPRGSHLYKRCKGGKRAADAREDLERLGQWGRWRCRNSVAIALSDERRCASSGRRRSRFHGRGRGRARRFSASCLFEREP